MLKEEELIILIREKTKYSYDYLYKNYADKIYGVICTIVTDKHKAEDVLQETFIKIWKNFNVYDTGKGRLFTWMVNIARNTAIDCLRRKEEIICRNTNKGCFEYAMHTYKRSCEQKIEQIGIPGLIARLKPDNQAIITLIYYRGYTLAQTATALDMPLGTIKTKLRHSIRVLRRAFTD